MWRHRVDVVKCHCFVTLVTCFPVSLPRCSAPSINVSHQRIYFGEGELENSVNCLHTFAHCSSRRQPWRIKLYVNHAERPLVTEKKSNVYLVLYKPHILRWDYEATHSIMHMNFATKELFFGTQYIYIYIYIYT